MADFQFGLQKVLDVREIEKDKAESKFLKAWKKKKEIENTLNEMNKKQKNLYRLIRNKENMDLEETLWARNYLHQRREQINEIEEKLEEQKKELQRREKKLLEKKKKKEVLEKLKEKEYNQFYNEFLHRQQKEIDEIGQQLISRQEE